MLFCKFSVYLRSVEYYGYDLFFLGYFELLRGIILSIFLWACAYLSGENHCK